MNDLDRQQSGVAEVLSADAGAKTCPVKGKWIRRIGAIGFLFFLIKGLLWLTVPAALVLWRSCAA